MDLRIEPIAAADQAAARALVLAGMEEHWGELDPTLNPDLDDIATHYDDAVFLVGRVGARVVATGALLLRSSDEGVIVRMAVAPDLRRHGLGRQMVAALCTEARARGMRRVVLETTTDWTDVVAFYERCGFRPTHQKIGTWSTDTWFALDL